MKSFQHLKIRTKMVISFGVIIVLVAALSLFAAMQLKKVDAAYRYVIDYPLQAEILMGDFENNVYDIRRLTASLSAYAEAKETEALYDEALEVFKNGDQNLNLLEYAVLADPRLPQTDKDLLLQKISGLRQLLADYKNQIVTPVAAAALEGSHEKTLEIIAAGKSTTDAFIERSGELLTAAGSVADQKSADAAAAADQTVLLLMAIAFLVTLLSVFMAVTVSSAVAKPIKKLADAAVHVARGNLDVPIDSDSRDETGILGKSFASVVETINALLKDLRRTADKIIGEGDIEARINAAEFGGSYRDVASSVNRLIEGQVNDVMMILNALTEISEGNFDVRIEPLPGKKVILNNKFDSLLSSLNNINSEIMGLAANAANGRLDVKADPGKYRGGFAELLTGLNGFIDAVAQPLQEIEHTMDAMAKGDFNIRMTGSYKGAFDSVKQEVNETNEAIHSYIAEVSQILEALSKGDLTGEIKREYIGQFTSIKDSINEISGSLEKTLGEIMSAASNVLSGAKQMSQSSMYLAEGSARQASAIEELTATIETINEGTRNNSENAETASRLSLDSTHSAQTGNDDMRIMVSSMEGIRESSSRVSDVIKTIEDMAFQTNLLALNAAVEAARAGSHGKGFAVVADEVRSLAAKSQVSAKETTAIIQDSIKKVGDGMNAAQETAAALEIIVGDARHVSELVSRINDLTHEQAESMAQLTIGISEISSVVQANSATSEECAAAAEELNSQAEIMRELVSFFKLKKARI